MRANRLPPISLIVVCIDCFDVKLSRIGRGIHMIYIYNGTIEAREIRQSTDDRIYISLCDQLHDARIWTLRHCGELRLRGFMHLVLTCQSLICTYDPLS